MGWVSATRSRWNLEMRKLSDHRWEMRARGPVRWTEGCPVSTGKRCEERDIRLRCANLEMPTICKASRVERWRWLAGTRKRSRYLSGTGTTLIKTLHSVPSEKDRECVIVLSNSTEDVHHSNEPHDLGNTSESRVDTEVQNYAMHHYFIYCEGPNSLSPNHGRDPATISASRV
jgi:hypothetical protein